MTQLGIFDGRKGMHDPYFQGLAHYIHFILMTSLFLLYHVYGFCHFQLVVSIFSLSRDRYFSTWHPY